jgi:hypothetical protein
MNPTYREEGDTSRTRTYMLVLLVETVVILGLLGFSRYFGGQ